MTQVLTLVAEPDLPDEAIEAARTALGQAGATERLGAKAADLFFVGEAADPKAISQALTPWPCDWAIQAAAGRRKRVLISDMDSTIITGESLDEVAALAGLGDKVASITARAMNGELDFTDALKERLGLLAGQPASLIDQVLAGLQPMPGAGALVATMKAHGARCVLVSGGLSHLVRPVAEKLGFDDWRSNAVEIVDGRLTGEIEGPVVDRQQKLQTLREEAAALGVAMEACLAVGDGANDMLMIEAAGLGVAFQAKPSVAAAARCRISHCGLDALLYFQGYREAEISQPRLK